MLHDTIPSQNVPPYPASALPEIIRSTVICPRVPSAKPSASRIMVSLYCAYELELASADVQQPGLKLSARAAEAA